MASCGPSSISRDTLFPLVGGEGVLGCAGAKSNNLEGINGTLPCHWSNRGKQSESKVGKAGSAYRSLVGSVHV